MTAEGPIIFDSVVNGLKDPLVRDNLPVPIRNAIDPILAKDPADWSNADKSEVAQAMTWCICNLPSQLAYPNK